jgi:cytoskeletal protein CcmA (bactofilin family)
MSILSRRRGAATAPTGSGYSLLDTQVTITGDLETAGSLRIDGRLDGTVRRADTVVLGVGATMSGDIHAREVVIGGTINGSVHGVERVELQATAIVTGDIVTQSVLVQEGGVVNGRVLMRPPESTVTDGSSSSLAGKPAPSTR